jgi:hypothetical protein
MKKLLLILLCLPMIGFGQGWEQQLFSGSSGNDVQQTTDGGYIITGSTYDTILEKEYGYLLKVSNNGTQQWIKKFHSPGWLDVVSCNSVQQTNDGGYIFCGGYGDAAWVGFLIRTDATGNLQWETNFTDEQYDVLETSDDKFVVISSDTITKIDANGNIEGTININFQATSVTESSNGSFVVCGNRNVGSNGGDNFISCLAKFNNNLGMMWNQDLPDNSDNQQVEDVKQTADGGYILTGFFKTGQGEGQAWLIKLNSFGYFEWDNKINGFPYEFSYSYAIDITADGGYIMTGFRRDTNDIYRNLLLIKTDAQGNLEWEKTFSSISDGYPTYSRGLGVQQTSDGGYIIVGLIFSNSISLGGFIKQTYLIKTNSQGNVTSTFNIPINPNRKLEKTVDILGRETKRQTNAPLIDIYDDGTVEKRIVIE